MSEGQSRSISPFFLRPILDPWPAIHRSTSIFSNELEQIDLQIPNQGFNRLSLGPVDGYGVAVLVCTVDLNKDLRRLAVSPCVKIKIEGANLDMSFRTT